MKTLIVNYFGLGTGGIEKYLQRLMRHAISEGKRVIWFTDTINFRSAAQRAVADHSKVEKVFFRHSRRKFFQKMPTLKIGSEEDVVMISFTPEDYVWAEQFRMQYKCKSFYHHLILMNFFGFLTYPEDEFKLPLLRKMRGRFSSRIAHKLDYNDNIRAFAEKQLVAFKERYDLDYEISDKKLLKGFSIEGAITEEELRAKATERDEEFKIVTCARFAFPHKGYLMGLLDVFAEIHRKHSQTQLIMVGDSNVAEFQKKYLSLADEVRSAITLTGAVPFDELTKIYRQCHLCIGLAGAASTAASIGLPTLVVRHDTYSCETYGFYHQVETTLKSDPGEDIIPFIEDIISMPIDEYISIGCACRENYAKKLTIDPDYILRETNKSSLPSVSKWDMAVNKGWVIVSLMKKYLRFL